MNIGWVVPCVALIADTIFFIILAIVISNAFYNDAYSKLLAPFIFPTIAFNVPIYASP